MKQTETQLLAQKSRIKGKNSLMAAVLMVAVVILGAVAVVATRAATNQLYLTPATGNVLIGNTVAVQIRVNSGTDPINAVQANLTYDPAKLEYQNIDASGSVFGLVPQSTTSSGSLQLVRSRNAGEAPVTGDNLFATVNFKALAGSGSAAVTVAAGSVVIRSTDNQNILVSSAGATYTLTSPVVPTPTPAATPTPTPVHTPTPTPVVPTPTPTVPTPTPTPVALSGSMYLTPASSTVASGSNVTLSLRENSGTTSVNAIQANLTYDTSKLQYVSVDATGADFPMVALTTANAGNLQLTRAINGGGSALTGDKLVAKVTFKVLATSGPATLGIGSGSAIATTLGQNALTTPVGATITVASSGGGGGTTPTPIPTATPTPVVVTPVVNTSRPTVVSGTIRLTTPSASQTSKTTYAVDNTALPSDELDTTTLDNGTHTVTSTSTETTGAKQTVKQDIKVSNAAPLWKNLVAGVKTSAPVAGVAFVVIALAGAAWFASRRYLATARLNNPESVHTNIVMPDSTKGPDGPTGSSGSGGSLL